MTAVTFLFANHPTTLLAVFAASSVWLVMHAAMRAMPAPAPVRVRRRRRDDQV